MQTYRRMQNWIWIRAAKDLTPSIGIDPKWFRIHAITMYDILNQAINLLIYLL
jgi:hypothetical protein